VRCIALTQNWVPAQIRDGVHVDRRRTMIRLGNTPIDLGLRAHIHRTIRSVRPDVVVAHTPVPYAAEMAYLAARRNRIPFVVTYHAGALRGSRPLLAAVARLHRSTLERRMLANAQGLIAVGAYVRDHALGRHRDRVQIVSPGVDTQRYTPAGRVEAASILFVGPVSTSYRWKGLDVLWDAFQIVRRSLPEARLTIVGDGDRLQEFTDKARQDGRAVRLAGRVSEDRLIDEYRQASVVVLPSTTDAESFGMVLAEANACGRPVVASRIGGIPDFVRDADNGLLADAGDVTDLADKLLTLLRDPTWANELGRRGRDRVVQEHDWDDLAAKTEGVLQQAVDGTAEASDGRPSLQGRMAKAVQ
jgi:glycosyltransferase involved in cell wall biosynthesis